MVLLVFLPGVVVGAQPAGKISDMADESANSNGKIAATVAELKQWIPVEDQAALESRVQALMNDPDADNDDVAAILVREFGVNAGE